jgi:hypothetical protein
MNLKQPIIQKVKEKLEEFGIEVHKEFKTKDGKEDVLLAEKITITSEDGDVFISFDLNANPSYAARVILILTEIKGIRDFCIGEDYVIDNNGKFLDGPEAIEYYRKHEKEKTINDYMNQQAQIFFMTKAKHYHC